MARHRTACGTPSPYNWTIGAFTDNRPSRSSTPFRSALRTAGPTVSTPMRVANPGTSTSTLAGGHGRGQKLPEIDQGFGLSGTLGVAAFTSGEAYKVGANFPYARMPRYFLRQTINLGGASEKVEEGINQFAGSQTADR